MDWIWDGNGIVTETKKKCKKNEMGIKWKWDGRANEVGNGM